MELAWKSDVSSIFVYYMFVMHDLLWMCNIIRRPSTARLGCALVTHPKV